jgi:hypothetical protein
VRWDGYPTYKNKQVPFLQFFCSSLFNGVGVARASFFSNQLCKPQNFAFALSKSFGKLSSLLSPRPTWQTSNPVFSQTYVLRVQPLFSPAETSFTALSFALSIINFFQLRAFAEGYNHKITCCVQSQNYE